ncbi:hypothetical protein [Hymenobacter ruricola]|uniref:Uncharacterized protein n=1 Tax=Hymenobacter ruricola TaxID=2791023 RepID=A0ABS0I5R5_9BACT|nr:hypothetical protein [Hymenobacter ruricola]MBF9222260.1 hypothetical protein [Hymenobacter ruricola]
MKNLSVFAALLLALPLAAAAQTTPSPTTKTTTTPAPAGTSPAAVPPGMQPQTEVTEDLDPATGKVIRRTTRTIYVPAGTPPSSTTSKTTAPTTTDSDVAASAATDAQVTTFLRKKTTVSTLTTAGLLDAYNRFMDRVRADRHSWKAADWATASAVLSSLNGRYEQLRSSYTFDDKLTIRSQQAEYQALRTGRQISDSVSDKL